MFGVAPLKERGHLINNSKEKAQIIVKQHNMRTHDETSREAQRLNITKPWVQVGLLLRKAICSYHT